MSWRRRLVLVALVATSACEPPPRLPASVPEPAPAEPKPPGHRAVAAIPDQDGDGVLDGADECPAEPEDRDGFEDDDGCPDHDNDGDGVRDAVALERRPDGSYTWTNDDRVTRDGEIIDCRDLPEDRDEHDDDDGCPDVLPIRDCQIVLGGSIVFLPDKWVFRPASHAVLDELVETLAAFPTLEVEIQNHRDERPTEAYGHSITQRRADAVRKYLIAHGVEPSRLQSRGYGPSRPLVPNTPADRARNRRTEIHITNCDTLPKSWSHL